MKNRTILWVFLAFILGFALPVCSCVGTGWATILAFSSLPARPASTGVGDAVAVIRLEGVISEGDATTFVNGITPERVADLLEQAEADMWVKAVVVRISSPGGGVVASDEIYHLLSKVEKPVVVWMSDVAASGGYYIACGADYIMANPTTLTGSIGVISQFINAEQLMEEIGVEVVVIASGPSKEMGSPFREMTEEERVIWEAIIDETYAGFVEVVAESRDLSEEEVRELADGRVYTGRQALALGLVDGLGTFDDAVARAAELGGIEGEPRIVELEWPLDFFDLMYGFQARSALPTLEELLGWAGTPSLEFRYVGP